jgi:acyl phosphate:glycerol-3-phosphate acyltransferase
VSLVTLVLLGLAGYVLSSLPWGYWLTRHITGADIRQVGSSNIGAANVWRAVGFRTFIAVAVLDIGKGSAAAGLGLAVGGRSGAVVAGTSAPRHPVHLGRVDHRSPRAAAPGPGLRWLGG